MPKNSPRTITTQQKLESPGLVLPNYGSFDAFFNRLTCPSDKYDYVCYGEMAESYTVGKFIDWNRDSYVKKWICDVKSGTRTCFYIIWYSLFDMFDGLRGGGGRCGEQREYFSKEKIVDNKIS